MTATPADMPPAAKPIPVSTQTRMALESLALSLAQTIDADAEELDLDAIVTLTQFVRSVGSLIAAQADYTRAMTERHITMRNGARR
ncbi:hypothetical protein OG911_16625 [Streptomyces sp. NBC_00208]|uniref:hypothetical protein n=1 Tax=Streptomyces sp. NBC_00208 TaxID=2975681 RepID=UPI002E2B551B|nr:hypothetical protein [Streptomyces sp. NBC_00208]